VRLHGPWRAVTAALAVVHFGVPFFALLSRRLKRRRRPLALVAAWLLMAHLLDVYWIVMPTLSRDRLVFPWAVVTAFFALGLGTVLVALWRLDGKSGVPAGDPYLAESLHYRQAQ
jgi:peptidoglycan/LPS O-acetylase OafA/YrhL